MNITWSCDWWAEVVGRMSSKLGDFGPFERGNNPLNPISRDPVINESHDLLGVDFLILSHKACGKNKIINNKKNICNLQIRAFLFFILGKLCSIANWGRSTITNSCRYCNLGWWLNTYLTYFAKKWKHIQFWLKIKVAPPFRLV